MYSIILCDLQTSKVQTVCKVNAQPHVHDCGQTSQSMVEVSLQTKTDQTPKKDLPKCVINIGTCIQNKISWNCVVFHD